METHVSEHLLPSTEENSDDKKDLIDNGMELVLNLFTNESVRYFVVFNCFLS